jgi:uncharacterized protein (DUF1778 family)
MLLPHMTNPSNTTSLVSVRVNPDERAIVERELACTNLSEFTRRKALESAEADVLNRTIVTIPAKVRSLGQAPPAEAIPALAELVRRTASWERRQVAVTPPRPLAESDDRNLFDCGRESLNI